VFKVEAGNLLSAFDGLSAKGVWTLRVQDVARGDVGRLTNWALVATGTLGGGSGQAAALGFRADPPAIAAAGDPLAPDFDAAPVAVAGTAPAAEVTSSSTVIDATSTPTAPAVAPAMSWLPGEAGRVEYAAPAAEGGASYTAGDARAALFGGGERERAGGSAVAVLYLAPEAADASDALATLFGDAE
jgi:hypothetical protein